MGKSLREMAADEEKMLIKAIDKNKLTKIKESLPTSTILAQMIYRKLVPKITTEFQLKKFTIKEIYKYIEKIPPSKCRGNDEINNYILKEIPKIMALAITHLYNHIIETGI